ncbi:Hint domain protein (plasmid) [Antarctobacter heliothermus]|uniref:Hint domain protein n=1 Tax=Antarctobacter heliothermus TaxID=74033 RepID=A0A222EBX2_9RHOB|nr:Hint domain-containing protein [Antarctobacter heliothermus]ASP23694.1 Hint domain protein [Antarctobacter heliothermus]
MPTTYTFGSSVGSDGIGSFFDDYDGTITTVVDDGSIQPGDAVTITGFDINTMSTGGVSGGTGFYLGNGTFNGANGYVFGGADTVAGNTNFFVVFDGDEGSQFSTAIDVGNFVDDPSSQPLDDDPACFAVGSMIATPDGETAVECLKIGDPVMTANGRHVPVTWVGRKTVHKAFASPRVQPVRIRAKALGFGQPHSDLVVTSDHAIVLEGLAINAGALVNGTSISFVPLNKQPDLNVYYHIETEEHEVILANGAPAETYIDYVQRKAFDNYQEYLDLYGEERTISELELPRISGKRFVPQSIRARLQGELGKAPGFVVDSLNVGYGGLGRRQISEYLDRVVVHPPSDQVANL